MDGGLGFGDLFLSFRVTLTPNISLLQHIKPIEKLLCGEGGKQNYFSLDLAEQLFNLEQNFALMSSLFVTPVTTMQ